MIENVNIDNANVSAELHGFLYHAVFGYNTVLAYGSELNCDIVSNNEVIIGDGLLCNYGRFMRILGTESIKIENGTSGVKRTDLIVAHFETDGVTEIHDIRVKKGANGGTTPAYTQGNIYNGATVNELPLYAIHLDGLNISYVEKKFSPMCSVDGLKNAVGNPNLLINSFFINGAINGRGKSSYTSNGQKMYTIDRWFITGTGKTVKRNSQYIALTSTGTDCYINQVVEGLKVDNRKYTLSAYINSKVREFTFVHDGTSKTKTFDDGISMVAEMGGSNELSVAVGFTNGGTVANIDWIKLEIGSVATPIIPRLYMEELDKCKRYFDKETVYAPIIYSHSTSKVKIGLNYLKQKRATPTITYASSFAYDSNNSQINPTATEFKGTTSEGTMADVTFSKALDDGASAIRITLEIDAEIY